MSTEMCTCGKNPCRPIKHGSINPNDWTYGPCLECSAEEILVEAGVYKRHANSRLDDFESHFRKYVGHGVYIFGKTGNGKTRLAVALLREDVLEKIKPVFTTATNMLLEIKSSFQPDATRTETEIIDYYSKVKNLCIDDIGVERPTDWALTTLYTIIDRRYGEELRTVFTSNMSPGELAVHLGARITSRIAEMCKIVELTGDDRRTK